MGDGGAKDPPIAPRPGRARLSRNGLPPIVHRGRPVARFDELYAKLVQLSWPRLALLFITLYLGATTFFAALYHLAPGSIANAREGSFVDAWAFSFQTIATIGYGALYPATLYAHVLVTIEALGGLLGVALTTGLVFAKFSQPRSNFVWSRVAVVGTWNGRRTLMLRVINARGSEVIEARARVSAVMMAVTPEGRPVRRVVDLALTRSEQPLFYAGWVFHVLDATSPLHDLEHDAWIAQDVVLVATLTGIESTYAQTVHSRMSWPAEAVRFGHVFADAIHFRDDGAVEIEHQKLHDTSPER